VQTVPLSTVLAEKNMTDVLERIRKVAEFESLQGYARLKWMVNRAKSIRVGA